MEGEFSVLRVVVTSCSATHPILPHLPSHQTRDSPLSYGCVSGVYRQGKGWRSGTARERESPFSPDPVSIWGEERALSEHCMEHAWGGMNRLERTRTKGSPFPLPLSITVRAEDRERVFAPSSNSTQIILHLHHPFPSFVSHDHDNPLCQSSLTQAHTSPIVTVVRNASQIPSVLSPTSTSTPSFGSLDQQSNFPGSRSSPSSSRPFTPVILVPLSDILTIPSLSLLLQQGTTPTAVCFQQDLLERARKTEEEWLPHALDQIRSVVEMRDRGLMTHDNSGLPPISETPVILAYSANPALSSSTIAACVGVGAAGVLKPPYDLETSRLVRRMVRAAREGRVSSVVGLPAYLLPSAMPGHSTPNEVLSEDEEDTRRQVGRVILPPTALSMGGEHEGEKVLSGAFHKQHRRGTSTQWDLGSNMTPSGRSREMSAPYTIQRKHSNPPPGQVAPSTSVQSIITSSSSKSRFPAFSQDERDIDHAERHQLTSLYHYNPTLQQRRRSVDTSGLGLALLRAQRVFEKQQSVPSLLSPAAMSRSHSLGVQDDDDEKSYSANSTPRLGSKAFTPKSAARPHSAVRGLAMGSNASLTRAVDERDDHDHEHRDGDRCKDTELAELLSAMYYQTRLAIDIQMDEYEQ